MGLAYVTEGFYGYDGLGLIPNNAKYSKDAGYIVFNEELNKPEFIRDEE